MVLLGVGLALVTAPATEAIMGSLPQEKAGVGSAVNDTTRELGRHPRRGRHRFGLQLPVRPGAGPAPLRPAHPGRRPGSGPQSSVQAAAVVAEQAPPAGQPIILDAATDAFLDGLSGGVRVAGVATLVGAVAAALFLPSREVSPDHPDVPADLAAIVTDPS